MTRLASAAFQTTSFVLATLLFLSFLSAFCAVVVEAATSEEEPASAVFPDLEVLHHDCQDEEEAKGAFKVDLEAISSDNDAIIWTVVVNETGEVVAGGSSFGAYYLQAEAEKLSNGTYIICQSNVTLTDGCDGPEVQLVDHFTIELKKCTSDSDDDNAGVIAAIVVPLCIALLIVLAIIFTMSVNALMKVRQRREAKARATRRRGGEGLSRSNSMEEMEMSS
ncbi:hypothetical protein QOT17_020156 [Balamuthia mandrillaris]